jgi:hypothetical protein
MKEPVLIFSMTRITHQGPDNSEVIIWEVGMAIFAIALLQNAQVADSLATQKAKRAVLENWGISLAFRVVVVFEVAKDKNGRFGAYGVSILI